jgi:hypothetical protein
MSEFDPRATQISIPVSGRDLASFIVDLLGQRRATEKVFLGYSFIIDFQWLLNLHEVIAQRISSQNEGTLIDFKASLYFDSGRSNDIFTFSAFRSYRDISNETCIAVELNWVYLIKFPQKSLPEKQEINFTIAVDRYYKGKTRNRPYNFVEFLQIGMDMDSAIRIVIAYSDYTWGEDILAHISKLIESTVSKPDLLAKFVKFNLTPAMGAFWGIAWLITTLFLSGTQLRSLRTKGLDALRSLDATGAGDVTSQKLNVLILSAEVELNRNELTFFAYLLYLAAMFTLFAGIIGLRAGSFISINEHSAKFIDKCQRRLNTIRISFALALLIGIASGIFANKIYDLLKLANIL